MVRTSGCTQESLVAHKSPCLHGAYHVVLTTFSYIGVTTSSIILCCGLYVTCLGLTQPHSEHHNDNYTSYHDCVAGSKKAIYFCLPTSVTCRLLQYIEVSKSLQPLFNVFRVSIDSYRIQSCFDLLYIILLSIHDHTDTCVY